MFMDSPAPETCPSLHAGVLFCADFEGANDRVYERGIATPFPPAGSMVTVERAPPAASGDRALWIDSTGGDFGFLFETTSVTTNRLDAQLAVRFARFGPNDPDTTIIALGTRDLSFDHCYASLEIDPHPAPRLVLNSHCGPAVPPAEYRYTEVLPTLPDPEVWIAITFTLDLSASTATVTLDGAPTTLTLAYQTVKTGTTHVEAGATHGGAATGPRIGIDDLVVKTVP